MTSFLRLMQELARDYLRTDEDFRNIAIITDDTLDIEAAVEKALNDDRLASDGVSIIEKRGLCIVIAAQGGRVPNGNISAIHFLPGTMVFSVIENPAINRASGGNYYSGLEVIETLMAFMVLFQSTEAFGATFYPADKGLERTDLPEVGLIIWDATMHVNGGTEATSNAVDTPIITESLITRLATITCATDGAEIRYTTDGTRPDWRSTLYTAPVDTSGISQIRARGFKPGRTGSQIASASLGVDLTTENPETIRDESGEITLGPE